MRTEAYTPLPKSAFMIREKVFIEEQGFQNELDEVDDIALHIVMYDDGNEPVATCRVFESEEKQVFILGRLAVLKKYRGKGIGSNIIREAERLVKEKGGKSLTLHSQFRAKEFYSKLGFIEYGEIGYDEGCPHIWMRKSF